MSDITPLTPAEVDALDGTLVTSLENRLFATVRDRERQRDEALDNINEAVNWLPFIGKAIGVAGNEHDIQDGVVALVKERDELQRRLAEFKNGNAYSKLGGQIAEVSQERHRLERELAEARKVLAQVATMDLTSYASTSAAKDAAREKELK